MWIKYRACNVTEESDRTNALNGSLHFVACSGIGKGIAIGFAEEGVRVVPLSVCCCICSQRRKHTHPARLIPAWCRIVYHRCKPVPLCEKCGPP